MSFWWVSDAERSLSLPQFLELFVGGYCLAEGEGEAAAFDGVERDAAAEGAAVLEDGVERKQLSIR